MKSNRRTFISGLGAAVTLAPGFTLRAGTASNAALTQVDHKFLPTPKQVHDWHAAKDSKGGPTLAGSPSWHNYLDLLEKELRAAGVVDIFRNPIPYTRWHTTEFPDDSSWSLYVDGKKIRVASYGANSGKTPGDGVTAPLVVYKRGMPADELRGKIAVVVKSHADSTAAPTDDYEYLSDPRRRAGSVVRPGRDRAANRSPRRVDHGLDVGLLVVEGAPGLSRHPALHQSDGYHEPDLRRADDRRARVPQDVASLKTSIRGICRHCLSPTNGFFY